MVASLLKTELRAIDVLARFGRSSFVALIPGVRAEQASPYADRLAQLIQSRGFPDGSRHILTCQYAVASYPKDGSTIHSLLKVLQSTINERRRVAVSINEEKDKNILESHPASRRTVLISKLQD